MSKALTTLRIVAYRGSRGIEVTRLSGTRDTLGENTLGENTPPTARSVAKFRKTVGKPWGKPPYGVTVARRYRAISIGAMVLLASMIAQISSGASSQPRLIHSQITEATAETSISKA